LAPAITISRQAGINSIQQNHFDHQRLQNVKQKTIRWLMMCLGVAAFPSLLYPSFGVCVFSELICIFNNPDCNILILTIFL